MRRTGLIAASVALLVAAGAQGAIAAEPRASLPDVEDEVMCTICGTLLAESESPQADRERALIRSLIAQGENKEQIKDALVAQYGPRVLATPSGHGFDLLAWLVPGIAILIALGGIVYVLATQRRSPEPAAPVSDLDPAERTQLERDMSSYDL